MLSHAFKAWPPHKDTSSRFSVGLTADLTPNQAGTNMGEHKQRQLNRRTTNNEATEATSLLRRSAQSVRTLRSTLH